MDNDTRVLSDVPKYALQDTEKDSGDVSIKSSAVSSLSQEPHALDGTLEVPLKWKLMAILMVTAISFGGKWSQGITGAMKSTMKKQMKINNKQFALLEASEDFMVTALMLCSGIITDRIGGASMLTNFSRLGSRS